MEEVTERVVLTVVENQGPFLNTEVPRRIPELIDELKARG